MPTVQMLELPMPFNAHGHSRIGSMMRTIIPLVRRMYGGFVVMPNPKQFHITTVDRLIEYYEMHVAIDAEIDWVMKLYFTESLTPREVERAARLPFFGGLKYYPAGLTTNSEDGITDPSLLWTPGTMPYEVMRAMADIGKPISYHGADGFNALGDELDPYDQEEHFYRNSFPRIIDTHPEGVHIGEHVSTISGADAFRRFGSKKIGCTVTPHHAGLDRRDVYRGGFHPDLFCWPVIQPNVHMREIRNFMTEGHPFVMLGDDGAGHPREAKECGCCSGGVFNVNVAVELYAELFEERGALEHFPAFASFNGRRFYGLPMPERRITLAKEAWHPQTRFECDDGTTVVGYQHPIRDAKKGQPPLQWRIVD